MMVLVWLVLVLVFAVAEVATVALFAAFIAVGALAAAGAAAMGAGLIVQSVVFAAVSLLGLIVFRPPLMRYVQRRRVRGLLSGAESMIGQSAPVVDAIRGPHQHGHVRIAGENWPALSQDGAPVKVGSTVEVVGLRQATLVVAEKATRKEGFK